MIEDAVEVANASSGIAVLRVAVAVAELGIRLEEIAGWENAGKGERETQREVGEVASRIEELESGVMGKGEKEVAKAEEKEESTDRELRETRVGVI